MDFCGNAAWIGGELVSTTIGSGFIDTGGGVETKKLLVEETFWGVEVGAAAVAVFVAALITDLKLKMLPKPPETFEFVPGALERLWFSWMEFIFVPPPLIIPSIPVPPITTAAAAPINEDPINPDVVDGLSSLFEFSDDGKMMQFMKCIQQIGYFWVKRAQKEKKIVEDQLRKWKNKKQKLIKWKKVSNF